ncbi:MAG: DUF4290 domain-containing protein [Weeksellaceae bacterium]
MTAIEEMEYNTSRKPLIIPEYGRYIQQMVDYCTNIEDDKDRNDFAEAIIDIMGNLNPQLRNVPDFQHKLWDQLLIMSDFKLKINSPFPIPSKEEVYSKPNRIPYPKEEFKYRYYGKNIRKMIDVALQWEGDKREGLVMVIANHMKKCYLIWNKDTVEDKTIFEHLYELSDGKIDLRNSEEPLMSSDRFQSSGNQQSNQYKKKGKSNHQKKKHKYN